MHPGSGRFAVIYAWILPYTLKLPFPTIAVPHLYTHGCFFAGRLVKRIY